ncbi:glycosyltransferase family A protein [Halioglobus sp. HI00S01]|uniref:glycosyltransferase family A protein n=1 Tax=Halioglobus sp. HI00S01 TaxID=1822214 RepID=UPI0018D28EB2|nr:glycosyltransferase family A protein [Halioglobus sp. HI00S01]
MKGPNFISVVIPTHNRGKLVRFAIESAASQTDENMEIIVSDTSTRVEDQLQVREAVEKAKLNSSVSVSLVRPDKRLNMADHWEFAAKGFTGDYLAILCDHYALRPSAVSTWREIIGNSASSPDIVMSNVRSGYSSVTRTERTASFTGEIVSRSAQDVLRDFLKFDAWNDDSMLATNLPRGMNCLYSRRICDAVRDQHGKLFHEISPDYTSSFLLLAHALDVLLVDKPFYCTFGSQSNGRNSVVNGMEKFLENYPGVDPFQDCPTRIHAVQNTLYRDFYAMKRVEPKLGDYHIDTVGYCLSLYREIMVKEFHGSGLDTKDMKAEWHHYVGTLDSESRQRIDHGVEVLAARRKKNTLVRKVLFKLGLFEKSRDVYREARIRIGNATGRPQLRYENVVNAVAGTDSYLKD